MEAKPGDADSHEIIVYPNPTAETVTINSTFDINNVTVYTIDGKQIGVFRNPMTSNVFSINVQNLSIGIYNFKINTATGNVNKKVIIRR